MLQNEYYVIERDGSYALFSWDQSSGQFGLGAPVQFEGPVELRVREPASSQPELVDFHELPEPVISPRISDVLAPLDIYGVQLVPAKVRIPGEKPPIAYDYRFVHIWNRINCLDKEQSELELYDDGAIFGIEKLTLDEGVLKSFGLHKRLVFQLAEKVSVSLVHESIRDHFMSAGPVGLRFINVADWYSDVVFE